MAVVTDDHLLLGVLAGLPSEAIAEEMRAEVVYTTACWYQHLARTVQAGSGSGSLAGGVGSHRASRA